MTCNKGSQVRFRESTRSPKSKAVMMETRTLSCQDKAMRITPIRGTSRQTRRVEAMRLTQTSVSYLTAISIWRIDRRIQEMGEWQGLILTQESTCIPCNQSLKRTKRAVLRKSCTLRIWVNLNTIRISKRDPAVLWPCREMPSKWRQLKWQPTGRPTMLLLRTTSMEDKVQLWQINTPRMSIRTLAKDRVLSLSRPLKWIMSSCLRPTSTIQKANFKSCITRLKNKAIFSNKWTILKAGTKVTVPWECRTMEVYQSPRWTWWTPRIHKATKCLPMEIANRVKTNTFNSNRWCREEISY